MKQFTPPIETRDSDELIVISKSTTDEWQADAIEIAKTELTKRGIGQKEIDKRFAHLEKEYYEQIERDLETASKEDYTVFEKLWILFFWPREIFHGWNLRKYGYTLMARRRIQLIIIGIILYIIMIYLSV